MLRAKGASELGKGACLGTLGTITLSCSPVGIVDGVSGDSQLIKAVGGRW